MVLVMLERAVSSPVADADFSELSRTLERLIDDPALGLDILHALAGGTIPAALRGVAEHLSAGLDADIALDLEVDAMVSRARSAQRAFERWSEWRVNELLAALSDTLTDHAEELARASRERDRTRQHRGQDRQEPVCEPDDLRVAHQRNRTGRAVSGRRSTGH